MRRIIVRGKISFDPDIIIFEGEGKMYRVLIVEDQRIPRQLFKMIVEQSENYELLYCVESAQVAHIYCDRYKIDLVIMDVVMQDGANGLDAAERIKKAHPEIKIIIVTSMPEVSFVERAKRIGADSFWYKEVETEELICVMDRTMSGESVYPDASPGVWLGNAKSSELTKRELDVLRELTTGAANSEIAAKLGIDVTTVKTHIRNMLQKTGFANRTMLAIRARVAGVVVS